LDRLNFRRNQMFEIGNVGAVAVKNHLAAAGGACATNQIVQKMIPWLTTERALGGRQR